MRCPPLFLELHTHLVPVLGLFWRSTTGVGAVSGSVILVGELESPAHEDSGYPTSGGEDRRVAMASD